MSSKQTAETCGSRASEILNFQYHSTYIKFGAKLQLSRCEDQCCGCSKVHCPFCDVHNFKPSRPARVRDHLNQTHFKHAVLHTGRNVVIVKCYMKCVVSSGHFHCPYCPKELLKKAGFLYHLRTHLRKAGRPVSLAQAPNFKQPEKILFDGHVILLCSDQCHGSLGKHYHCPLCAVRSFEDMGPLSDHLWRCREVAGLADRTAIEPPSKKNTEKLWAENIALNVKAPAPKERFGQKCHISVVRNVGDLPLSRCEEVGCCRRRYHCALCSRTKFKPAFQSHIQEHYLTHWNSRAECGAYSSLVCYLPCLPRWGIAVYHFHCPKCGTVRRRKAQFMTHVEECLGSEMKRDKELYGVADTSANTGDQELNVDDPPVEKADTAMGDNLFHNLIGTRGDNSLDTDIVSIVDVTLEEIEPETTAEIKEIAEIAMETSEASVANLDEQKIWEVYDKVSADLSLEYLTALDIQSPLEDFLQTIAEEAKVEVITSPGTSNSPRFSLVGTWDNVSTAKLKLRQKLPKTFIKSMNEREMNNTLSQDNPSCEVEQDTRTGGPNSSQDQLNTSTSESIATHWSPPTRSKDVSGVKSSKVQKLSKSPGRRSTRSVHRSASKLLHNSDINALDQPKGADYVPTALDMLSSAVEIIKKEEETHKGQCEINPISSAGVTESRTTPRCGRKRKPQTQDVSSSGKDKASRRSSGVQKDVSTPTGKRYSTRGNKLDFSLLATGKKRKDPKPKPVPVTEPASPPSPPPTPQLSVSMTQTVEEEEEEEEEGEEEADVSWSYNDPEDLDISTAPSSQKLIFSSMAVIPVVTFDMQSNFMTKFLTKSLELEPKPKPTKVYSCSLCEFESSVFFDLVHHCAAEHNIDEDLHCEECLVICLNDDMREDHFKKFHDKKQGNSIKDGIHNCSHCDFEAVKFSDVTDHIISVHNTECLRCDVCERMFNQHKSLDIHLALKHGPRLLASSGVEKRLRKCHMCPFDGESFSALTDHLMNLHHMTNLNRCDICERVFENEFTLEVHLKKQHGPSEEHLSANRCSICGMLCKNKKTLSQHQIYIHKKPKKNKDDISLECKTCYYMAESVEDIREHRIQHKNGVLKCFECDRSFGNKANLQFHMQLYHKKSEPASCEICGKKFRHKRYIIGHMKRHTGKKKYTCEQCGKTFYERSAMKVHQNVHKMSGDREYRYICSYCGQRYNSKSNLNDHLNKHTGEKPYKCDICNRDFAFRSQLSQHKIFIHSTARPFKCTECNKSFKMAAKLQQHMVIHTGVGKHNCEHCGRACSSAAALRGHQKKCQLGILKKPRLALAGVSVTQDVASAADSILEMAVDSYVIVNSQESMHDLQPLTELHEAAGTRADGEVYACSVCKQEFEYYQNAVDHINSAHEDGGTEGQSGQTDTVVLTEESLPHGAVIKIEETGQEGVTMEVGTFEY